MLEIFVTLPSTAWKYDDDVGSHGVLQPQNEVWILAAISIRVFLYQTISFLRKLVNVHAV